MIFGFFSKRKQERDKQKLLSDLENGTMKDLVLKMASREPYSSVIAAQRKKNASFSSADDISWFAHRFSNKLDKPSQKEQLLDLLKKNELPGYRKYIFSCLSNLCSNTNDYELLDLLLKQVEKETGEDIVISILSRLDKLVKLPDTDISIIKHLAKEGTADVRIMALKALANSQQDDVEDLLLSEFKTGDRHTKGMICTPLRSVGTEKAIAVLQDERKRTREPFLKWAIDHAVGEIEKRIK